MVTTIKTIERRSPASSLFIPIRPTIIMVLIFIKHCVFIPTKYSITIITIAIIIPFLKDKWHFLFCSLKKQIIPI
jgi:hypothetical protein